MPAHACATTRAHGSTVLALVDLSQRAWNAYFDAEVELRWPPNAADFGTIYPMCVATDMARMCNARARLRRWCMSKRAMVVSRAGSARTDLAQDRVSPRFQRESRGSVVVRLLSCPRSSMKTCSSRMRSRMWRGARCVRGDCMESRIGGACATTDCSWRNTPDGGIQTARLAMLG